MYIFLLLTSLFAYTQKKDTKIITHFSQKNGEITIDVQCIDEDRKKYMINWEYDSAWLKNNGYDAEENNGELVLTCAIYGAKHKILHIEKGENKGSGSCIVTSRKNVVSLVFAIRKNKDIRYPKEDCNVGEFLPIKVNLDKTSNVDRHATPKRRKHYTFPLVNNEHILLLSYHNNPFDNMPSTKVCDFHIVIHPEHYYLSLKNGQIRKGKSWLLLKSVKQIVQELQLVEIEPMATYQNKKGEVFLGEALIKAKKIAIESFDLRRIYR